MLDGMRVLSQEAKGDKDDNKDQYNQGNTQDTPIASS
jgi:hypothetical protein